MIHLSYKMFAPQCWQLVRTCLFSVHRHSFTANVDRCQSIISFPTSEVVTFFDHCSMARKNNFFSTVWYRTNVQWRLTDAELDGSLQHSVVISRYLFRSWTVLVDYKRRNHIHTLCTGQVWKIIHIYLQYVTLLLVIRLRDLKYTLNL